MNPSRQTALSAARYVYTSLVERARDAADDPELVDAIHRAWEDKLGSLSSFKTDPMLSDETSMAVASLVAAVLRTPDDDLDALLRWLDVYPDAVTQLFPPSESTFSVVLENAIEAPALEAGRFALVA